MDRISGNRIRWLLIAVTVIWFSNLEYRILIKPDEGRYAEIPREMAMSGDWTTPRLNDLKYFEKPPLQYWATAIAYTVFGEHQWTSRLWAGLTGFAGIFLVWFAGARLFGREAGAYAALLLGSSMLYVLIGHVNTLDMGVTFFITLGIAGLLLAQTQTDLAKRRNWMLLAWLGMGLAVLSKGLMGIVLPGAALFIYCLVQRDFSVLKRMNWLPGLAVFLLITAPWFYLVMKANPEFFGRFFIYEHYTRFTTKDLGRYQPWYYFIPILLSGALPWTVLMFDTMVNTWRDSKRFFEPARNGQPFVPERFLLIWAVFIYLFFTVSGSKLPSYLLPMFPALALLMGRRIAEMRERVLLWQIAPVVPAMLVLMGLALNIEQYADNPQQAELYPHYSAWLVTAAVILLSGLLAGMLLLWRAKKLVAVLAMAVSTLLAAQIGLSGYNTIARERSAKHIAEAIRPYVRPAEDKQEVPFYSVLTYEQTLPFYLQRTFTLVQYQDEMAFGIQQEPHRWIPTLEEFARVWAAQPEALAIMPVYAYALLQQQGLSMIIIFEDSQHIVVSKP
ncbi:MAG: phospholipid carrier-dependent glycosyltransferase [Betaproteobacteria bacterium RBG_16_56_24]|nr:MAG: phospholipid carrier-dependent glycosyltransferase [Betaproteobacteria bacterium RBG_16_56_24]